MGGALDLEVVRINRIILLTNEGSEMLKPLQGLAFRRFLSLVLFVNCPA